MLQERKEKPGQTQLERLSAVISLRGSGKDLHYLGWARDGSPLIHSDDRLLTQRAQGALDSFHASRQHPVKAPYRGVTPFNYAYGLTAIDFRDDRKRRIVAEDQVRFNVSAGSGRDAQRQNIHIGELDLLRAIHDAQVPFQEAGAVSTTASVVEPHSMYTLLIPDTTGRRGDRGVAVLFRPDDRDVSNEMAFAKFVRDVISRLILFDETTTQRGETPKGYIKAAADFTRTSDGGKGSLGLLNGLRKAGIVEFDEEWAQEFAQAKRNVKARGIQLLRGLGVVEIDDVMIDSIREPLPDYDIDVDIHTLFDVADAMEQAASRVLRR